MVDYYLLKRNINFRPAKLRSVRQRETPPDEKNANLSPPPVQTPGTWQILKLRITDLPRSLSLHVKTRTCAENS